MTPCGPCKRPESTAQLHRALWTSAEEKGAGRSPSCVHRVRLPTFLPGPGGGRPGTRGSLGRCSLAISGVLDFKTHGSPDSSSSLREAGNPFSPDVLFGVSHPPAI